MEHYKWNYSFGNDYPTHYRSEVSRSTNVSNVLQTRS